MSVITPSESTLINLASVPDNEYDNPPVPLADIVTTAFWFSFKSPFPALKCAPPLENWIMTGLLTSAAVSRTALIVLVPITLTAGRAKDFSLASLKTFWIPKFIRG